MIYMGDPNIN